VENLSYKIMSSILAKIFLESLLSLPLKVALEKINNNDDIESKDLEIIFIDEINKEYFEKNFGENKDMLRVVNAKFEDKIKLYVAYELTELVEKKEKGKHRKNVKN